MSRHSIVSAGLALVLSCLAPGALGQPASEIESSAPVERDEEATTGMGAQAISGWVLFSVGGASLVAGIVTGTMALDKHNLLDQACPERQCEPTYHGEVDLFGTLRTTSTITVLAGGALLVGGVTLLLTAPAEEGSDAEQATSNSARAQGGASSGPRARSAVRVAPPQVRARLGVGSIVIEGAF